MAVTIQYGYNNKKGHIILLYKTFISCNFAMIDAVLEMYFAASNL